MKRLLPFVLVGLALACSKPADDSASSADSTAAIPEPQVEPGAKAASLTPEEIERVNFEIFLRFHNDLLYDGDPEVMAYVEEFTTNGNEFHYKLLRHNGGKAGMTQDTPPEPEPEPEAQAESSEASDESNVSEEGDAADGDYTNEPSYTYVSEIDTIYIDGRYIAFPVGDPESTLKTVKLVFAGKQRFVNANYVTYGSPVFSPEERNIMEMTVELAAPRQLQRDQLYLKAKVTTLTDEDLARLSKDELTIVRNEIFARHGHTFKTDKMITYFAQKNWYHSLIDDAASLLNKFEKQNVEFIKKKEG